MSYDTDNIFAKIIRGEIPCDKVFENDHVLAFNDITPQAKIHILVIPKGHYIDLNDFNKNASDAEILSFNRTVANIILQHKLVQNGFRAIANAGEFGGQEVPHYHLHLLGGEKLPPMMVQE